MVSWWLSSFFPFDSTVKAFDDEISVSIVCPITSETWWVSPHESYFKICPSGIWYCRMTPVWGSPYTGAVLAAHPANIPMAKNTGSSSENVCMFRLFIFTSKSLILLLYTYIYIYVKQVIQGRRENNKRAFAECKIKIEIQLDFL